MAQSKGRRRKSTRKKRQTPEEWLAHWRARLREPGPWAERFRRLADAIAHADAPLETSRCRALEPMREAYVDDLWRGEKLGRRYGPLQRHLRTCAYCQEQVQTLLNMLSADAPTTVTDMAGLAPSLSFLPSWENKLWSVVPLSQLQRPVRGLAIDVSPTHLSHSLATRSATRRRFERDSGQTLLMADRVTVEAEPWDVEIVVRQHAETPDNLTLCTTIVSETPSPWLVTLKWGERTFVQTADEHGQVCFPDLPVSVLQRAHPPIQLEIEATDSVPSS